MAKKIRFEQKTFNEWLIQSAGDLIALVIIVGLAALFTIYIHSKP